MEQNQTYIGIYHTDDGYEQLTNAIILQAVKDYRQAISRLTKHPDNSKALLAKLDTELFFRSNWFAMLTNIDPEKLIRKLREKVAV